MKNNFKLAGVDEVGRGCLAGPVFAAAVILNKNINIKNIKDSKKIPFKRRIFLSKYIKDNSIILFMKGTKKMPMCGFSNSVTQVLNHYGVKYKDINVLEDPNIRVALSEYSNWPTIPQLFVNGELIGGADITLELHQNGELLDILDKANS